MNNSHMSYKAASRQGWGKSAAEGCKVTFNVEELTLGALERIADSLEALQNHFVPKPPNSYDEAEPFAKVEAFLNAAKAKIGREAKDRLKREIGNVFPMRVHLSDDLTQIGYAAAERGGRLFQCSIAEYTGTEEPIIQDDLENGLKAVRNADLLALAKTYSGRPGTKRVEEITRMIAAVEAAVGRTDDSDRRPVGVE